MTIFFLQKFVNFSMIADSFLVEKWGTLEHAKRYVCKNLLNLDCQDSVCFAFSSWLKVNNYLGRVFPSHFLRNLLIEFSNVSYLVLCHFLISRSLKIQNALKDIFSITSFNNSWQRRNMYFEGLVIGLYNI